MRTYKASDTGIPYRVINHWEKCGLLPYRSAKDTGWRTFSTVELAWLKAVQRFRRYGFSLDKIARVKKSVLDRKEGSERFPVFEYYVERAYSSEDDPYIIALYDGTGAIGSAEEIEIAKKAHFKTNDMLLISLKSILNEIGPKAVPPKPLMWLSDPESDAISSVRSGKHTEVSIKLKKRRIRELETTEIVPVDPALLEINKTFKEKGYHGDVTVKYENGIRQSAVIKKRKLYK
ncbi:MAG: MerR family transcriptional regulator [bacterium]